MSTDSRIQEKHPKQPRSITFEHRALFVTVLLVILYLFTEAVSLSGLWLTGGLPLKRHKQTRLQLSRGVESPTQRLMPEHEVLHPYLGFVTDPNLVPGVNEFGFSNTGSICSKRSSDSFIIGILGGSVAEQFCTDEADSLQKIIQEHMPYRDVRLVCMAQAGYKQPQQLITLAYFLALGAEFDVVINIDGFNEVALPLLDVVETNQNTNTFYAYPRRWHFRVADVFDPKLVSVVARIRTIRETRRSWARLFNSPVVGDLPTTNLVWLCRERWLSAQIDADQLTLLKTKTDDPRYCETGPIRKFQPEEQLLCKAVELWRRCSLQIANLCRANDVRYHHVLQPNLHVDGSKPMGNEERETTRVSNEGFVYRRAVQKGYPLLIQAGQELAKSGVSFHDLTMVYSQIHQPIYIDCCCHYNTFGNMILSRAIAEKLIPDISP